MATRLYFTDDVSPISPAVAAAWVDKTQVARRMLSVAKGTTALVTQSGTTAAAAGSNAVARQYISPPLAGDQAISGTWSLMLDGRELAATDNLNQRVRRAIVVSGDGTVSRGTLRALAAAATTTEYATTLQGILVDNATSLTTVNALDGDRILIELGPGTSAGGTTPQWELRWGEVGTDYALSNGDTTGTVPWVEFSATLAFQAPIVTAAGSIPHVSAVAAAGTVVKDTASAVPHALAVTAAATRVQPATAPIPHALGIAAAGTGVQPAASTLSHTMAVAAAAQIVSQAISGGGTAIAGGTWGAVTLGTPPGTVHQQPPSGEGEVSVG